MTSNTKPVEGQIDFTRNMGAYVIQHKWVDSQCSDPVHLMLMKSAETPNGDYIGDTKTARLLVKKFGIQRFEKSDTKDNVCSIGFNPDTKTWFGWSHRAISSFAGRNAKQRARRFAESVS